MLKITSSKKTVEIDVNMKSSEKFESERNDVCSISVIFAFMSRPVTLAVLLKGALRLIEHREANSEKLKVMMQQLALTMVSNLKGRG